MDYFIGMIVNYEFQLQFGMRIKKCPDFRNEMQA